MSARYAEPNVHGISKITLRQQKHTSGDGDWYSVTIAFEAPDGSYCSLGVFSGGADPIEIINQGGENG